MITFYLDGFFFLSVFPPYCIFKAFLLLKMDLYTLEAFRNLQETKACSSPSDADSLNLRSSDITGNPFEVPAA